MIFIFLPEEKLKSTIYPFLEKENGVRFIMLNFALGNKNKICFRVLFTLFIHLS